MLLAIWSWMLEEAHVAETQLPPEIDPLTLAVVKASLEQVTNEMDTVFYTTAFSPVIAEGLDLANGIYDCTNGEVIVQGEKGLPIFIGVMQFTVQGVISQIRDVAPGDVYIVNDPYAGGTHVMDVKFVAPYFYRGELFAFLANTGHWPDFGGAVPGGFSSQATEIFQEGLRLPPVRICTGGALNSDLVKVIMANIRVPEERHGDLRAHLSALRIGEQRLTEVLDRYGLETIRRCMAELRVRSERLMRSRIEEIPDGTYQAEDYLDSDGVVNEPLKIGLDLTVTGSELHLDFSRSSPPCQGPLNSVISASTSACYIAVKHIFPDVPTNAGAFVPLTVTIPEQTFLNAAFPKPVSGCAAEVSQRIVDTIFRALAAAIPEDMFAAPVGTSCNFTMGGSDPRRAPYVMYIYSGGGYGGYADGDGLTHGPATIGSTRTQPMEIYEQNYPVRFSRFGLREESAGAGTHRGGFGVVWEFELLRGEGVVSLLGDRGKFGPFGIEGGREAARTEFIFHKADGEYRPAHVTKDEKVHLSAGDRVTILTPGGGGYGDPFARTPERVLRDVERGYLSRAAARADYGVVVEGDEPQVDLRQTARLRGNPPAT